MLNKKNFFIILFIATIVILFTFNWYKNNENKAFNEAKNIAFVKSKINYINYLENIFKIPVINNKFCKKINKDDIIIYKCKNLTKNNFQDFEDKILNRLVNIKSFHIYSNGKKIDLTMEIYKK